MISEKKMQIVIDNYFKSECNVDTSIRDAFEKGFRIGVQKTAPLADDVQGEWIEREDWNGDYYYDCSVCGESFVLCDGTPSMNLYHFCPNCGARMTPSKGGDEYEKCVEQMEHDIMYEPTYNQDDGSM